MVISRLKGDLKEAARDFMAKVDVYVDIYGLGLLMLYMAVGTRNWTHETVWNEPFLRELINNSEALGSNDNPIVKKLKQSLLFLVKRCLVKRDKTFTLYKTMDEVCKEIMEQYQTVTGVKLGKMFLTTV
jgi:hypothetical protein